MSYIVYFKCNGKGFSSYKSVRAKSTIPIALKVKPIFILGFIFFRGELLLLFQFQYVS